MDNWKNYFKREILKRGRDYYYEDRVFFSGKSKQGIHTFIVDGENQKYKVNIREVNNEDYYDCNCPYFMQSGNCKHIAASLYYMAEHHMDTEKKTYITDKTNPFIKKDNKFRFYDLSKITKNIIFTEENYKKAQNIITQKKYKNFKIQFNLQNYNDEYYNAAECMILGEDIYPIVAYVDFNRNEIINIRCDDNMCYFNYTYYRNKYHNSISKEYIKNEICYHQIVILLLLDKYFEENDKYDSTSLNSEIILKQLKNNTFYFNNLPILNKQKELNLEIQFYFFYDNVSVGFKVGYEKSYTINCISDFIDNMKNNNVMLFGSQTQLLLSEKNLSEKSRVLYNIIKKHSYSMQFFGKYININKGTLYIKKEIPFEGSFADEIFDYLLTTKDTFKISKNKLCGNAILEDFILETTITDVAKKYNDENSIAVNIKMPILSFGINNVYFFNKDNNLCGCKNEQIQTFMFLFNNDSIKTELLSDNIKMIELVFGRNKISDFYNDILPILSLYGNVNDTTGLNVKLKIKNKAVYLFKIDYNDYLLCKLYKKDNSMEVSIFPNDNLDYEEKDIVSCVKTYFPIYDKEKNVFKSESTIDEMYYILGVVLPYYMQIGEVEISENIKKLEKPKTVTVSVGISIKSDLIDLNIDAGELSKDDIEDILSAYKRKVKYYKAKNNDIIDIENSNLEILEGIQNISGLSSTELLSKNISLPLYRAIYLDELLKDRDEKESNRDEKFTKLINDFENAKNENYELPKNIIANLRNYQIQGYRWIKMLDKTGFCGILADEMGLGKTLQTILFLTSLYENGEKNISIIITPASLIYNWKQEFEKFAPNIKVLTVSGMQDERKQLLNNIEDYNVLITSYDLFKRDIDLYNDIDFRCEVIDEAQYIKNQTTQASKSTKVIKSKFRLALTGTPIENRLSELWSIFDFIMPNYLYNYTKFKKLFEVPIIKDNDNDKLLAIKKMVSPFILRRKKMDVLKDLPEKIDNNYYVQMNESQSKLYKAEALKLKMMITKSDYDKDKIVILSQITKLRQICCDPSLVYENYNDESIKKVSCISLIQNAIEEGHKMLVFSQFTSMLDILAKELTNVNVKYYMITGKTSKNERIYLVEKFNNDDVPVFLISLKAGGTGLNLTGADIVIHYDPWWNVSVQNQATDRAHRIGQKKVVNIYKLITKNTIEEKIIQMQGKKEKISNDILGGELGGLSNLSKDDLLDLINVEN